MRTNQPDRIHLPGLEELREGFADKFGDPQRDADWGPRMRWDFDYFTPDDHYESLLRSLVLPETRWLDIGCGRFLLQSNEALARKLSERCAYLHGVDPDRTIQENQVVHEYTQCAIEDFETSERFDLITLRMVAEHVEHPDRLIGKIRDIAAPGARIVVYTIFKWSPIPIVTWLVPFRLHHVAKRWLWNTEEKDTFPVAYRMNTRRELLELMNRGGFTEIMFEYLDDCRTLGRFKAGQWLELTLARGLNALKLHYPEVCILGVYQLTGQDGTK